MFKTAFGLKQSVSQKAGLMGALHPLPKPPKKLVGGGPPFIFQADFDSPEAEECFGLLPPEEDQTSSYMAEETMRDLAMRMHYAAWRSNTAKRGRDASRWLDRYHELRNRIVVGNRKLAFRAVQKWGAVSKISEDVASECHIVLIKAVAAFNPWLNIRFSTYAFTCLMRALSRLAQRHLADRLSRSLNLEMLPEDESLSAYREDFESTEADQLHSYFREDNQVLTEREKFVLSRRFHLGEETTCGDTLEQVGKALGISKERTRQLQKLALEKLRNALAPVVRAS